MKVLRERRNGKEIGENTLIFGQRIQSSKWAEERMKTLSSLASKIFIMFLNGQQSANTEKISQLKQTTFHSTLRILYFDSRSINLILFTLPFVTQKREIFQMQRWFLRELIKVIKDSRLNSFMQSILQRMINWPYLAT